MSLFSHTVPKAEKGESGYLIPEKKGLRLTLNSVCGQDFQYSDLGINDQFGCFKSDEVNLCILHRLRWAKMNFPCCVNLTEVFFVSRRRDYACEAIFPHRGAWGQWWDSPIEPVSPAASVTWPDVLVATKETGCAGRGGPSWRTANLPQITGLCISVASSSLFVYQLHLKWLKWRSDWIRSSKFCKRRFHTNERLQSIKFFK